MRQAACTNQFGFIPNGSYVSVLARFLNVQYLARPIVQVVVSVNISASGCIVGFRAHLVEAAVLPCPPDLEKVAWRNDS